MDAGALSLELLSMAAEDLRVREQLASDGSLFEGYHRRMREVHERNAERLSAILHEHGWPGRSLVGEEAAQAAWLILQHAISNPALQRRGLSLLGTAAAASEVPTVQVAMLEDRIRSNEGRGQLYGTQVDWDEYGQLNPLPIEDEENVDARRRDIGLGPLAQHIQRKRELAVREGERPPLDWKARQRDKEDWLRAVGWRT
jgi:Family of unknown function (DUF6624)